MDSLNDSFDNNFDIAIAFEVFSVYLRPIWISDKSHRKRNFNLKIIRLCIGL